MRTQVSAGATPVLPDRVPRLFGSANSRASVTGHCVPRRTLRPSPDTASLAGHDCAPSGTVVAPYPIACHDCSARRTVVRQSPDTASLAGHCVRRRTRLCPKRHSRGTLPDRVPRLFGSANSRASVTGHCVRRRTRLCPKRHSRGTLPDRVPRLFGSANSRASLAGHCVPRRTLRPSQDTASVAGHDCAPSGTVVAPYPIACHDCSARRTVVRPSPDAASVAGHCVRRRTRLCPKRHSRGTLSDRVPRLFGSANSRASVTGHCVPRRTRLCPKRHSRGTRPRVIGRFARGTRSARTRPGACSSDSHHQAVAALASAGSPERARRRAAPRASICPGVCSALTQMRKYRSPGPPG